MKLSVQNNANFAEDDLQKEEMDTFTAQWAEMFMPAWSLERQLINSRLDVVLKAIKASKNIFVKKFGGFNPQGGEFGLTPIRPGQVGICAATVSEGNNTWIWPAATTAPGTAVGFDGWIHSPTAATTPYTLPLNLNIYPFYLAEESPTPILQTVKMDINRANILWLDMSAGHIRDPKAPNVCFYPLPNTFWSQQTNVEISIQTKKAGYMDLRLGGFAIGQTEMLDASSYTASTNTVTATKTAYT